MLHKLAERPTLMSDHLKLEALIISKNHMRIAATCSEENVIYDYRLGARAHLERDMAERLAGAWDYQESKRAHHLEQVAAIDKACKELEREVGIQG